MPGESQVPPTDLTGRTLRGFHVLRRLGEGGMGQVYLAEQISLKRKVALKLLKKELAGDPVSLERFKAEAFAVAKATHANIVQVYDIAEDDGLFFIALEYVEGRNLLDYLTKKGTLDAPLAISVMRQVAAALQRAAELNIIHRDIKPENILLTRKGEVKVADFGLSRNFAPDGQPLNLTQSGVTMGTPLYMSPEQVQGFPLDPRTDIYSFGVTCFHMLVGHPPFRGNTAFEVALQHVQNNPGQLSLLRPDLPPGLCAIVQRMMAKKPEDRYQSGRELLRDLSKLRESISGTTPVPSSPSAFEGTPTASPNPETSSQGLTSTPWPLASAPSQGRWLWGAFIASLVTVGVVAGALGYRHKTPTRENADSAEKDIDIRQLEAQFTPSKKEQSLREAAKLYSDPGKNPDKIRIGLELYRDLALHYLEQDRFREADQLFQELMNNPAQVEMYAHFGKLGHAIVLGLDSRAEDSIRLFLDVLPRPAARNPGKPLEPRERVFWTILGNSKIRAWIAEALEYDLKNDPNHFRKELERWRKPPNPSGEAGPAKGT